MVGTKQNTSMHIDGCNEDGLNNGNTFQRESKSRKRQNNHHDSSEKMNAKKITRQIPAIKNNTILNNLRLHNLTGINSSRH